MSLPRPIALCLGLFLAAFLATSTAAAQASVRREDLFRRAFQSTSFFLMMADSQPHFRRNLTPAEQEAYAHITFLAHMSNQRQWVRNAGAHNFGRGDADAFVYVMAEGEQGVRVETKARAELVFSDDESLFRLKPGQPDRTAATSTDAREPIYVNRRKIEKPDFHMSFAEVVGLAVHEYGNKVPAKLDQAAIDSLAAKIQEFVSRNTRVLQTPTGALSVTSLDLPRNHFSEYLQMSLTRPEGSAPGTPSKLWLVGDQGLAIFHEDGREVKDLTNVFTDSVTRSSFQEPPRDPSFDWLNLRWNLASGARVIPLRDSSFRLEMSLEIQSAYVPFANERSPDPRRDRPWSRQAANPLLKTTQNLDMQWTVDVGGPPKITSTWRRQTTIRDPSVPVEKVGSEWRGRDFVLIYKLPAKYQVPGFQGGEFPLRPYLQLRHGDESLEIPGRPAEGHPDRFEFLLKDAAAAKNVEVVGLEIGAGEARSTEMLMADTLRVKLLLPQNELLTLPRPGVDADFSLKTVQLWDGERWISLRRTHDKIPRGSHLRFVFDSRTELSSLVLQQSYQQRLEMGLSLPGRPDTMLPEGRIGVNDRSFTVRADQLKQTRLGDKLIVDWQVDRDFLLNENTRMDVDPRAAADFLRRMGIPITEVPPWARQVTNIDVQAPRRIGAVGATNLDLQTLRMSPEQLFRFDKAETATEPSPPRPRGGAPACRAVFH